MKLESYYKGKFNVGELLMDVKSGEMVVFVGYTPEHPEYVAKVTGPTGVGRTRGVRPFDLERYQRVRARSEVNPDQRNQWNPEPEPVAAPLPPAAPVEQVPHPIERPRRFNLDA